MYSTFEFVAQMRSASLAVGTVPKKRQGKDIKAYQEEFRTGPEKELVRRANANGREP
jgi:hypothetical protein